MHTVSAGWICVRVELLLQGRCRSADGTSRPSGRDLLSYALGTAVGYVQTELLQHQSEMSDESQGTRQLVGSLTDQEAPAAGQAGQKHEDTGC